MTTHRLPRPPTSTTTTLMSPPYLSYPDPAPITRRLSVTVPAARFPSQPILNFTIHTPRIPLRNLLPSCMRAARLSLPARAPIPVACPSAQLYSRYDSGYALDSALGALSSRTGTGCLLLDSAGLNPPAICGRPAWLARQHLQASTRDLRPQSCVFLLPAAFTPICQPRRQVHQGTAVQ